jgi:hypothetical protein
VLPERVEVRVLQENSDTIYLVLPSVSAVVGQGGSLSDQDLEEVAGGAVGIAAETGLNFTCGSGSLC